MCENACAHTSFISQYMSISERYSNTQECVCVYVRACVGACMRVYVAVCVCACVRGCVHACVCGCVCKCVHVCVGTDLRL